MSDMIPERWQELTPFDWTAEEHAWIRDHVGIYIWDKGSEAPGEPAYRLQDYLPLAKQIGTKIVRPFLGGYGSNAPSITHDATFLDNLASPAHQATIQAFDTIFYTIATPPPIWQPDWTAARYQEITEYLLRNTSGKTFVLGNWEGDHWCPGTEHTWEEAIALFQARHDGIIAGRAAVPGATSKVYEMIEMVILDYTGQDRMINRLAPLMQADLYSLSAWRYHDDLPKAVAYMKSKCPPSPDFGNDNVMLGEFGFPRSVYYRPEERITYFQHRIRQLKEAKAPYVIYWDMGDKDDGLVDGRNHQSRKFMLWYQFSRAFHSADQTLTIDDFEIRTPNLPGGDQDEDGYSDNSVGGRRGPTGGALSALVWQQDVPSRVLQITLPQGCAVGSGWQEQLLGSLDASKYQEVSLRAKGNLLGMSLQLIDADGQVATAALGDASETNGWIEVYTMRNSLPGVDWSQLSSIDIITNAPGDGRTILVDDISFGSLADSMPREAGAASPRTASVALTSTDQPLLLNDADSSLRQIRLSTPATDTILIAPELTDGDRTIRLAERMPGLHTIEVGAEGAGTLSYGPVGYHINPMYHAKVGLTAQDLIWSEQHHLLQPALPDQACYLEWRVDLPFPIIEYRLVLYSKCLPESRAKIGISVSQDGERWNEQNLVAGACNWREDCHFVTTPENHIPSGHLWVRFWCRADSADTGLPFTFSEAIGYCDATGWQPTANLYDIKVRLTLDTHDTEMPHLHDLRYCDTNANIGYRGLLDLDW